MHLKILETYFCRLSDSGGYKDSYIIQRQPLDALITSTTNNWRGNADVFRVAFHQYHIWSSIIPLFSITTLLEICIPIEMHWAWSCSFLRPQAEGLTNLAMTCSELNEKKTQRTALFVFPYRAHALHVQILIVGQKKAITIHKAARPKRERAQGIY